MTNTVEIKASKFREVSRWVGAYCPKCKEPIVLFHSPELSTNNNHDPVCKKCHRIIKLI